MTDAGISQTAKTEPVPLAMGLQSNTRVLCSETDDALCAIATPPEQLWDQAYDDLKHDEPKLFELYEIILSRDLDSSEGLKGNGIEQNRMKRRSQMDRLLNTGLNKTARLVHTSKRTLAMP
jgi:hypothetical protein